MEDTGKRKPVLALQRWLTNNITDHLLTKFTVLLLRERAGTIFKSPLIVNVKRLYHSNTTNLLFRIDD